MFFWCSHKGLIHLFTDDKNSGLRNWLREVCMSVDTCRSSILAFSSETEEYRQLLQDIVVPCVLEIKLLAAIIHNYGHLKQLAVSQPHLVGSFSHKGATLVLDKLHLKAYRKFDGSISLVKIRFGSVPEGRHNTY